MTAPLRVSVDDGPHRSTMSKHYSHGLLDASTPVVRSRGPSGGHVVRATRELARAHRIGFPPGPMTVTSTNRDPTRLLGLNPIQKPPTSYSFICSSCAATFSRVGLLALG